MLSIIPMSPPTGPLKRVQTAEREQRRQAFVGLLHLCGLTGAQAAEILGLQHQSLRQKATGNRPVNDAELVALSSVWSRIQRGDVDGLPDGCTAVAAALAWIRREQPHPDDEAVDDRTDDQADFDPRDDDGEH